MNNAQALLEALRNDGVNLWLEESELRFRAPKGVMSQERIEALRAVKKELIEFLQEAKESNFQLPSLSITKERPTSLPLSYMQERLWALDKIEGLGSAYHITGGVSLKGTFDLAIFESALENIVHRHDSLRTRFSVRNGIPEQFIDPYAVICVEGRDVSSIGPVQNKENIENIIHEFIQRPFNLSVGNLCRVMILHLSNTEHICAIVMHHIISDGWSLQILINELAALYVALKKGEGSPFKLDQPQFVDYAIWQKKWLNGNILERQIKYWKGKLEGISGTLEMPLDRPRPTKQKHEGANYQFTLPVELPEKLLNMANAQNATLFMVLVSAFQMLLSLRTGQKDIILGTSVAGRTDSKTKGMIGFFANTLVLRTDLSDDINFLQLINRTKETVIDAYANQDLPYDRMLREVLPSRDHSKHPIFQTFIALHNYPQSKIALSDLTFEPLDSHLLSTHASKRDFSLHMVEKNGGITGVVQYSKELFDEASIEDIVNQYVILLRLSVENPQRRLSSITAELTRAWRQQLNAWNNKQQGYPDKAIHELFERQAELNPNKIAVVYENTKITYEELNKKANHFANKIIRLGVVANPLVALYCDRSVEMIIGILAIMKAGGAYLPLSPFQPNDRLYGILNDSEPVAVVTLLKYKKVFEVSVCMSKYESEIKAIYLDEFENGFYDEGKTGICRSEKDLAYVIYTSGSTGVPKGVAVKDASINNFSAVVARDIYKGRESLNLTINAPCFFDMSLKHISQLAYGHSLYILHEDMRLSPQNLINYFKENNINGFECTPSQLSLLLDYINSTTSKKHYLPEYVLLGGEMVGQDMWEHLKSINSTVFYNMYGPTEATVDCMYCEISDQQRPSIGYPISNYNIYLLNKDLEPVPLGVPGEIYIAGIGLASGYLNNPDLTAEKFIPDPFSLAPGQRMYKSGDLARFNYDGEIEYIGRIDEQVKIRGFRVELGEIESALSGYYGIKKAIVNFVDGQHLVAYMLMGHEMPLPDRKHLINLLKKKIPDYMLPSFFIPIEAIPLTINGKIDRSKLPPIDFTKIKEDFVAPISQQELIVSNIWSEVLNLDKISIHDNFFDLGGHSMLAVRVLGRLYDEYGVDLPVRKLFENPTISQFSLLLNLLEPPIPDFDIHTCIQTGFDKKPLFCIHPSQGDIGYVYNFKGNLSDDLPIYGISALGFLEGEPINTSIQDMATSYIIAIRKVQSFGPYRIIGWSAGGTIAWEIAKQLLDSGQNVEFLGLIDTVAHYEEKYCSSNIEDAASYLLNILGERISGKLFQELHGLYKVNNTDGMLLLLQEKGLLPSDITLPLLNRHLQVRFGIAQALAKYKPLPLPIDVTFYHAIEGKENDISLDWKHIQKEDRFNIKEFAATHASIVEPPKVDLLANDIQKALAKLDDKKPYDK
ncbi:non-ribosomal peptide synthetase [Pantoea allii]|nr:non-ribosomal peptide synthetase [Pantoea allii]THB85437.1 non-ribosomal peptide synthetase [Pantoea allii]